MYPFNELCFDGFGVYTVAVIQVVVFWIVMPYSTTSLHGITTQENSTWVSLHGFWYYIYILNVTYYPFWRHWCAEHRKNMLNFMIYCHYKSEVWTKADQHTQDEVQ